MIILTSILICFIAYGIGSIPFGVLLTRWANTIDIRTIGSGNIGATNVLRTGRKDLAALTLGLDMAKGALVVIAAQITVPYVLPQLIVQGGATTAGTVHGLLGTLPLENLIFIVGVFVFLGHLYPVWLNFKGGKGVATFFGVMLGYAYPAGLLALATWIVIALISKRSSLAALVATALCPIYLALLDLDLFLGTNTFQTITPYMPYLLCIAMVGLIWARHQDNIERLIKGTEPKIESFTS
jgi:acyl phosphate:glycerol-3-phosphate acyltransferase